MSGEAEDKMEKAHDLSKYTRTSDVSIDENITFADMLLSERTLKGLEAAGFKKPSPIQRKAVPYGRCGYDLIVQAKSGTGKTCVFTIIAMEMVVPSLKKVQVMVLAPTREISVQIANVMSSIARCMGNINVQSFIGGLPFEKDKKKIKKCQIAVGAPGRMKHLVSSGLVDLTTIRLFVLDEADRLMEPNFRADISYIFSKLPLNKQLIAVSATFPEELEKFVAQFMNKPIRISPTGNPILIGVRQFALPVTFHPIVLCQMRNKTAALSHILSSVSFKQCLVFANYQSWAENICHEIAKQGWNAIYINSSQNQSDRLKAYNTVKQNRCRVLFSTDLTSRGIDVENVNLVVNLDLPYDCATYLHRVGRAGRYGTHGIAVTIVQEGDELERFRKLLYNVGGTDFHVFLLKKDDSLRNIWEARDDQFEKLSGLVGEYNKIEKKKASDMLPVRKEEQVNLKKEEASQIIRESLLKPPESDNFRTWEALKNDLDKFKVDESKSILKQDKKPAINPVSASVKSSIIFLENEGWDSFYKEFQASKKRIAEASASNSVAYPKTDLNYAINKNIEKVVKVAKVFKIESDESDESDENNENDEIDENIQNVENGEKVQNYDNAENDLNVQNDQNDQNDQIDENIQNIQNIQNAENDVNVQNDQNVQIDANIQNVKNDENDVNVQNDQNDQIDENIQNVKNDENDENDENVHNVHNVQNVQNVQNVKMIETIKKIENALNAGSAGNIKNDQNDQKVQKVQMIKKIENSGNIKTDQNDQKVQIIQMIKKIENAGNAGNIKKDQNDQKVQKVQMIKKIENAGNAGNAGNVKNGQNDQKVQKVKMIKKIKNAGNIPTGQNDQILETIKKIERVMNAGNIKNDQNDKKVQKVQMIKKIENAGNAGNAGNIKNDQNDQKVQIIQMIKKIENAGNIKNDQNIKNQNGKIDQNVQTDRNVTVDKNVQTDKNFTTDQKVQTEPNGRKSKNKKVQTDPTDGNKTPRDKKMKPENSDGNMASSEPSQSGQGSEEPMIINRASGLGYTNEMLNNWLSMWVDQSRVIRNYVQYCNYWRNMMDHK